MRRVSGGRQVEPTARPLPLVNGERMTQAEFHRRYQSRPPGEKWELIGGVVYMASPLRRSHGLYHSALGGAFWLYSNETPGVEVLDNATTLLGEESEPQPDLALRVLAAFGGRSRETEDNYVAGPPELVAEVAHSSRDLDLHAKRADYEAAGVIEYVVLCVEERELVWFDFAAGAPIRPTRQGHYRSRVFPGLRIDSAALLDGDGRRVADMVRQGLDTPEHRRFVRRLQTEWRKHRPK